MQLWHKHEPCSTKIKALRWAIIPFRVDNCAKYAIFHIGKASIGVFVEILKRWLSCLHDLEIFQTGSDLRWFYGRQWACKFPTFPRVFPTISVLLNRAEECAKPALDKRVIMWSSILLFKSMKLREGNQCMDGTHGVNATPRLLLDVHPCSQHPAVGLQKVRSQKSSKLFNSFYLCVVEEKNVINISVHW